MVLKTKLAFLLIIGFGFLIRVWKLDIPLLEFYPTRQVQTAEITQNLLKDNLNILYPRVDYFGPEKSYYLIEFPGYNSIVAIVHLILGGVNDANGRIVSVLSYLLATIFLYLFTKKIFDEEVGLLTAFFFTISPLNVLVSRSFQPEEMMIAASVGSLLYLQQWATSNRNFFLIVSALFFAWAVLLKITALVFLFLPFFYIISIKRGGLFKKTILFFFAIGLLPSLLWYFHAYSVSSKLTLSSLPGFDIFLWFGPKLLLDPKYFSTMFGVEFNTVILPAGLLLFLIGLLSKIKSGQFIVYWWLAGVALYFAIFNKHSMTHEYYHMPFLPIASIFMALGFSNILTSLKGIILSKTLIAILLLILITIMSLPETSSRAYKPIGRFSDVVNAGVAIQRIAGENDLIVGIMDRGPTAVYYANRVGWHFGLDREEQKKEFTFYTGEEQDLTSAEEDLENYIKKGAKFLVLATSEEFKKNENFQKYVYNNFELIDRGDKYLIFSLVRK